MAHMSIVAEFAIPTEALPGGGVLSEMPNTVLELERIVPTEENALPFLWVWSEKVDDFVRNVRNEDGIAAIEVLEEVDHGALIRATWTPKAELVHAIKELSPTILEAEATAEEWSFRIRTDDRQSVATFQEVFASHGIPVTLDRVYDLSRLVEGRQYELTSDQRETLIRAYEEGYYEKPRGVTQQELGEQFGVTSRAISDRLRRGTANLVEKTLLSAGSSASE